MDSNPPDATSKPEPMDADAYFEQAIEYSLDHDYEKAIAALTEAIRLSPANAKYYFRRATSHFIISDWNEAIADFTEALRLKPDPSDDDVWNFTIDEVYRGRARAYRYRGDYDASLADYDAALADFTELIRLQPDVPNHYRDRSVTYRIKGDFENSLADLQTLHRLDPNDSTYWELLALQQLKQGDKAAAMATYTEEIERFGTPTAYDYRGHLWKELGNLTNAIADFEKTIEIFPQHDPTYLTLGETYLANGDFTKAIDMLNEATKREPEINYAALLLRARAYLALGNIEQANQDFDETIRVNTEAIAKYPAFATAYVARGHAHAARGHAAEAVADYKKALEAQPDHLEADMMREYILKNS